MILLNLQSFADTSSSEIMNTKH